MKQQKQLRLKSKTNEELLIAIRKCEEKIYLKKDKDQKEKYTTIFQKILKEIKRRKKARRICGH